MKAVVLVDTLRWTEDGAVRTFEGPADELGVGTSAKGLEVDLPQDEFARLEAAGAVAKPRSKAAKAADESEPAEA